MTLINKCTVWLIAASCLILNSCTTQTRFKHDIIHLENVSWACNISTSFSHFGLTYEYEEHHDIHIPVSDGDLLYMMIDDDKELYYRYSVEDGNHLVVSQDTLHPRLVFINGIPNQIEISGEMTFEEMDTDFLTSHLHKLSTLLIRDTFTGEMMQALKKYLPDLDVTGIFFESDVLSAPFNELITSCKPEWIAMETIPFDEDAQQGLILNNLELLWMTGDSRNLSKIGSSCHNLESLIISDWEPEPGEIVPLENLKKLHTLTLAECGISDLSQIEFPPSLQRLHLAGCDTLTDISAISGLQQLQSLGLAGCDDVASLEPFKALRNLDRIAFPGNTSQEDFTAVVDQNRSLEVVELIECPGVKDLSPLKDVETLKILVFQHESELPEQLGSLDQLEMIVLSKNIFEESPEFITEVRAQLPNTLVVPGSGLCLGSGWLLMLLPAIILARFLFRRG